MKFNVINYKFDELKLKKRRWLSKFYYAVINSPVGSMALGKKCTEELKVTPCKSWGPDLYIRSFNEYNIPGKNVVYKIKLDDIPSYLLDNSQPPRILADLHSFNWISHIGITANKNIRKIIKEQISFWIQEFSKVRGIAWSPIVAANRVYRWLNCYFVIKSSEKELLNKFLISLHTQARYLYLIRNLYEDIEWITSVYKAILLYAVSANDEDTLKSISYELELIFSYTTLDINALSPLAMINILVGLLDIKTLVSSENSSLISHLNTRIKLLQDTLYTVNNDSGIGIFDSLYTPTRQFVSSILSSTSTPPNISDVRFIKASAFNSDLIIDKNDPAFAFDFHFANQIASTSNSVLIKILRDSGEYVESKVCATKSESEKGYFLFSGNSVYKYQEGNVSLSRRLYMNNLGTELRGEDVVASTLPASVMNEFLISDGAKIAKLAYQNGLSIEFLSGKKWLLLLSNNIDLTATKCAGKIINGTETSVTIIRLEAYKNAECDCVCKWSLKEV